MLKRAGAAAAVLGGSAVLGRKLWDQGGFGVDAAQGARQVRDFRDPSLRRETQFAELAVAKGGEAPTPEELVTRALAGLGGMKRFIARHDIVVVKPNIGWDRMPVHAANTNPDVVAAVVRAAYDAGAKKVVVADGSCNDPEPLLSALRDLEQGLRRGRGGRSSSGAPLSHDATSR